MTSFTRRSDRPAPVLTVVMVLAITVGQLMGAHSLLAGAEPGPSPVPAPQASLAFPVTGNTLGESTQLQVIVGNSTDLPTQTGLGFNLSVASGLLPVPGSVTNTCQGRASIVDGQLVLTDGAISGGQRRCTVSVAVKADTVGSWQQSPTSFTSTTIQAPAEAASVSFGVPTATDLQLVLPMGRRQTIDLFDGLQPGAGDPTPPAIDPASFRWGPGCRAFNDLQRECSGTVLTYQPETNDLLMVPPNNWTGNLPALSFTAADIYGNPVSATLSIELNGSAPTVPDQRRGNVFVGTRQVFAPLGQAQPGSTGAAIDPSSLVIFDASGAAVTEVVNETGRWVVDLTTSKVTFTPAPGFDGVAEVLFQVADVDGNLSRKALLQMSYPSVADTVVVGDQGQPVSMLVSGFQINPATVTLQDPITKEWSTTVTTTQGTWQLRPDGPRWQVVFEPAPGWTSDPDPILYRAEGTFSGTVSPRTLRVLYPDALPVSGAAAAGGRVVIEPSVIRAEASTVQLLDPITGQPSLGFDTSDGRWQVSAGRIEFLPAAGVLAPAPQRYVVRDADGHVTLPATVTAVGVQPTDLSQAIDQGRAATVPIPLDRVLDPSSLRVIDPVTGARVSTLVTAQGTWTLAGAAITFTPIAGVAGTEVTVAFTVRDDRDQETPPARLKLTFPDLVDAAFAEDQGVTVSGQLPISGDLDPETVRLVDPATGSFVTHLQVPQGNWTVESGRFTFVPASELAPSPDPVRWTAWTTQGQQAEPALLDVAFPVAVGLSKCGDPGEQVVVRPQVLDADPTQIQLIDPQTGLPTDDPVSLAGDGTFRVTPDGAIAFSPAPQLEGDPATIEFVVWDTQGHESQPATVTVVYAFVGDVTGTGIAGNPVSVAPEVGPATVAETLRLIDASGESVSRLEVAGEGVWTTSGGVVTYTPAAGVESSPTPVLVTAVDTDGHQAPAAMVTVVMLPSEVPGPQQPQPPVNQPPVAQPPVGQPPVGQPPVGQPPVGQPPVGQPPVGQPPVGQQPVVVRTGPGLPSTGQASTAQLLRSHAGLASIAIWLLAVTAIVGVTVKDRRDRF